MAGDVDSLREWMANGENGLICDHRDAKSLAACVGRALEGDSLRVNAAKTNRELIRTRGGYVNVMTGAETLYAEALESLEPRITPRVRALGQSPT